VDFNVHMSAMVFFARIDARIAALTQRIASRYDLTCSDVHIAEMEICPI